jgi:hypothetical protein
LCGDDIKSTMRITYKKHNFMMTNERAKWGARHQLAEPGHGGHGRGHWSLASLRRWLGLVAGAVLVTGAGR